MSNAKNNIEFKKLLLEKQASRTNRQILIRAASGGTIVASLFALLDNTIFDEKNSFLYYLIIGLVFATITIGSNLYERKRAVSKLKGV